MSSAVQSIVREGKEGEGREGEERWREGERVKETGVREGGTSTRQKETCLLDFFTLMHVLNILALSLSTMTCAFSRCSIIALI